MKIFAWIIFICCYKLIKSENKNQTRILSHHLLFIKGQLLKKHHLNLMHQ